MISVVPSLRSDALSDILTGRPWIGTRTYTHETATWFTEDMNMAQKKMRKTANFKKPHTQRERQEKARETPETARKTTHTGARENNRRGRTRPTRTRPYQCTRWEREDTT